MMALYENDNIKCDYVSVEMDTDDRVTLVLRSNSGAFIECRMPLNAQAAKIEPCDGVLRVSTFKERER